jgi:hypothetical protein
MTFFTGNLSSTALCALLAGAVFSLSASAQVASTNGYVCAPKNPGGEETRLYFRQQGGQAVNLAPDASFPVVCPVIIDPVLSSSHAVVIGLANNNSSTQDFSCALEENTVAGATIRTIGRSLKVGRASGGVMIWENIALSDPTSYFSVRCILPPKGGVSLVAWYNFQ